MSDHEKEGMLDLLRLVKQLLETIFAYLRQLPEKLEGKVDRLTLYVLVGFAILLAWQLFCAWVGRAKK